MSMTNHAPGSGYLSMAVSVGGQERTFMVRLGSAGTQPTVTGTKLAYELGEDVKDWIDRLRAVAVRVSATVPEAKPRRGWVRGKVADKPDSTVADTVSVVVVHAEAMVSGHTYAVALDATTTSPPFRTAAGLVNAAREQLANDMTARPKTIPTVPSKPMMEGEM
jgi:hypothetical protein